MPFVVFVLLCSIFNICEINMGFLQTLQEDCHVKTPHNLKAFSFLIDLSVGYDLLWHQ